MTQSERFSIGASERSKRWRNIAWGGVLSAALVIVVLVAHERDPTTYNVTLLWSVVGFAVLANLVNLARFLRYQRLIREHYLEVAPGMLRFSTRGQVTELDLGQVAAMRLFQRKGNMQHIQLRLTNGRGIRLEGYDNLAGLAQLLRDELPEGRVMD